MTILSCDLNFIDVHTSGPKVMYVTRGRLGFQKKTFELSTIVSRVSKYGCEY